MSARRSGMARVLSVPGTPNPDGAVPAAARAQAEAIEQARRDARNARRRERRRATRPAGDTAPRPAPPPEPEPVTLYWCTGCAQDVTREVWLSHHGRAADGRSLDGLLEAIPDGDPLLERLARPAAQRHNPMRLPGLGPLGGF